MSKEYKQVVTTAINTHLGLNHDFTLKCLHSLVAIQREFTSFFDTNDDYPLVVRYLSDDFNTLLIDMGYAFRDALTTDNGHFDTLTQRMDDFANVPQRIMALMNNKVYSKESKSDLSGDYSAEDPPKETENRSNDKKTILSVEEKPKTAATRISRNYDYYDEITSPKRTFSATKKSVTKIKKKIAMPGTRMKLSLNAPDLPDTPKKSPKVLNTDSIRTRGHHRTQSDNTHSSSISPANLAAIKWTCPSCTKINTVATRVCSSCGTPHKKTEEENPLVIISTTHIRDSQRSIEVSDKKKHKKRLSQKKDKHKKDKE